jgi:protein-S-isoprenylcysteine O-methyltransferase Ste14
MHWTQTILAVALTAYIGAFAVIMVRVRRSTDTNPRGHTGGHHLAAVLNIVATLLLLLSAIAYPLDARSVDWFGRIPLLDHAVAQGIGVGALTLSGVLLIWGEISLGHSFRVALPESKQALITHGIYRFTRNPLALSVDLLALGILLLAPSWVALASLVLNVASYEWKIRIEEAYLHEAHGEAYADYCARTGRYTPRFSHHRGPH